MAIVKRIFLFLTINILVVFTISLVLNFLHVKPYINAYGLNIQDLLLFCFVWGMGGAFISLLLSRHIAKWMMRVTLIDENTNDSDLQFVIQTVRRLSEQSQLGGIPQVGVYSSNEINAFATGATKKKSLIAVSSGLLNRLGRSQIEAILGHEVSHIANGDMVTMTLLQGIVNAFVMFLARILAFAISGLSKNRNNSRSSYGNFFMLSFLFEIIFMIFGSVIVAYFSRKREFRADRGGARLAGKSKMIEALKALRVVQEVKDPHKHPANFHALKISSSRKKSFFKLFSTHPPLEERIEKLSQMLE